MDTLQLISLLSKSLYDNSIMNQIIELKNILIKLKKNKILLEKIYIEYPELEIILDSLIGKLS